MTHTDPNLQAWLLFIQAKYDLKISMAFSQSIKINHLNREAPQTTNSDFYMTNTLICHPMSKPISKMIKR